MDYSESISYLEGLRINKFLNVNLNRVFFILEKLGHPERMYKKVHVTGTNGKGSIVSMVSNILFESGYNVGKFTSPHLEKYNERIQINGINIGDDEFAEITSMVKIVIDDLVAVNYIKGASWTEVLAIIGFVYFEIKNVDYAVIEVNIGGLRDATNIILPVVSIISNVALDHCNRLGNTISKIAYAKAGIIKENIPVVVGAENREALLQIIAFAKRKEAPCYVYNKDFYGVEITSSIIGQEFYFYIEGEEGIKYRIKLAGEHQIKNACLAIMSAKLLARTDKLITEKSIYMGLVNTSWPGRLEHISMNPDIILDGAHNPDGARALRKALDKFYPDKTIVFIFGMMNDKDIKNTIDVLLKPKDLVYTVAADDGDRPAKASYLAELIGKQAICTPNLTSAYYQALASSKNMDNIVVVCGSLHLVGKIKMLLNHIKNIKSV